ncbi:hypothetical protein FOXG_17800 [Fusarium oxysporum f. sp. lycopersici 4287]|uniref:Uncharacterized protein n=3 Tax=Fusarium oxysporum TaxID=5507 RepID=W9IJ85_FUSOX|nr:hypothetical protein FOXG_17800 [Fusarium oxysporum f. sp. lycopersici 4287]EWY94692.1 hypothetical protein FOYG_07308 [Fusarium oxysporum NRRL 32931]EXK47249.1 hypothetical protein FOMG_00724 [Fusarium oxysporum f. sp. melonis 26406]KNA93645.1 hypothetical protein FOXG_17800 [Fusarium oxysporum f. sp. lycopersici 4287]
MTHRTRISVWTTTGTPHSNKALLHLVESSCQVDHALVLNNICLVTYISQLYRFFMSFARAISFRWIPFAKHTPGFMSKQRFNVAEQNTVISRPSRMSSGHVPLNNIRPAWRGSQSWNLRTAVTRNTFRRIFS